MPYVAGLRPTALSEIAGTSLTGSYQTVYTASDDLIIFFLFNDCNKAFYVSFDGGTTTHFRVPAKANIVLDMTSNDGRLRKPTVAIKHAGTVPTSGYISITGCIIS